MSSMGDTVYLTEQQVREWFNAAWEESDGEFLLDLQYANKGQVFEIPDVNDFQFTVEDPRLDSKYDSYGSLDVDGYIVFSVTGIDGTSKLFKLPYYYSSYEGERWETHNITEVAKTQKVITIWEWTDVTNS
jgi:hypothetical protein